MLSMLRNWVLIVILVNGFISSFENKFVLI